MIIFHCPSCRHKYMMKSRPGKTFTCPSCGYSAPFNIVLNGRNDLSSRITNTDLPPVTPAEMTPSSPFASQEKTRIVDSMQGKTSVDFPAVEGGDGEKTRLVIGLQKPKQYIFQVTFGNMKGSVRLPLTGQFTLGRNSSDSPAQIKLSPDPAMSRVHAGMRVISQQGLPAYQITSMKESNLVSVNGRTVPKGHPYTLKDGDMVQMGSTKLIFKPQ